MWNVILCDDEQSVRSLLQEYLRRFSDECGQSFRTVECSSAEQLLCQVLPDTDLIFLDIRMGTLNGMEAAHILRRQNADVCLVFLTSLVQYALEGYRVHAFGFLQKPLSYAQFRLQMADVLRTLQMRRTESIPIKVGCETHNLIPARILYAEVRNHSLEICLTDGALTYYGTITELEELLSGRGFSRCHKSFLVNLRRVSKVTSADVVMENGKMLPLSKRRRKEFLEELTDYLGSAIE